MRYLSKVSVCSGHLFSGVSFGTDVVDKPEQELGVFFRINHGRQAIPYLCLRISLIEIVYQRGEKSTNRTDFVEALPPHFN